MVGGVLFRQPVAIFAVIKLVLKIQKKNIYVIAFFYHIISIFFTIVLAYSFLTVFKNLARDYLC